MEYWTWVPIDSQGRHTGEAARGLCSSMAQAWEYMQPFTPHETEPPGAKCPSWIVKNGQGYWLTLVRH